MLFVRPISPLIISLLMLISPGVFAGQCGGGKILELKEGGWNSDDLMIKLDYSEFKNNHAGSEFRGYVRFRATILTETRLTAIRRVALTALVSGKTVLTYSHTGDCSNATDLTIYAAY